jgi:hypothetical protein
MVLMAPENDEDEIVDLLGSNHPAQSHYEGHLGGNSRTNGGGST